MTALPTFLLLILAAITLGAFGDSYFIEDCTSFQRSQASQLTVSSQKIPVLGSKCLANLIDVTYLQLKNCKIQEIEEDAFSKMESLKVLDLPNNFLTYLPENLFEQNRQLERVLLKNNKFTAVPYISVPLGKLDLSRNKISYLNFTKTLHVNSLDLSHNKFETLPSQNLEILNKVGMINLNDNPWKCGSEFDEVSCWSLSRMNTTLYKIPLKCKTKFRNQISYTLDRRQEICGQTIEIPSDLAPSPKDDVETNTKGQHSETPVQETSGNEVKTTLPTRPPINETSSWPLIVICAIMSISAGCILFVVVLAIKLSFKSREYDDSRHDNCHVNSQFDDNGTGNSHSNNITSEPSTEPLYQEVP